MPLLNSELRRIENQAKELLLILATFLTGGLLTETQYNEYALNIIRNAAKDSLEATNQSVRSQLLPQAEEATTIALLLDRVKDDLAAEATDLLDADTPEELEAIRQRIAQTAWFSVWSVYGAAIKRIAQLSGKLIAWITAGDERTCPICLDNEAKGPYTYETLPVYPAHVACRCELVVV